MWGERKLTRVYSYSYMYVGVDFACDEHGMYVRSINPRRACAARVTVVGSVCLSVCLSGKSHLTSGASVHPENAVTDSAANEG